MHTFGMGVVPEWFTRSKMSGEGEGTERTTYADPGVGL